MTIEEYWEIWEKSWIVNEGVNSYESLKSFLKELSLNDLKEFSRMFERFRRQLVGPKHLAAAYLLYEGIFEIEDFLEYSEAVAAIPKEIYFDVLGAPDRIFDYPQFGDLLNRDGYPFATAAASIGEERFGSLWRSKCQQRGEPIDFGDIEFDGLRGLDLVTPEVCKILVPRFYKVYGANCDW